MERHEKWREVTIGEALHSLDCGLRLSIANYEVAFLNTTLPGQQGRIAEIENDDEGRYIATTADMLRYTKRPDTLEALALGQYLMFYRLSKPGQEEAIPRFGQEVNVCTPDDLPPPAAHALLLPHTVTLADGEVVRLRRVPRALSWGPESDYASILLFTVSVAMTNTTFQYLIIIFDENDCW